jgi:hypothetical protein
MHGRPGEGLAITGSYLDRSELAAPRRWRCCSAALRRCDLAVIGGGGVAELGRQVRGYMV